MTEQLTGLVAVDAGGTSTRAVVLDPAGHCLGHAVAGSGNPIAVGPETAAASVAESVTGALEKAKVPSTADPVGRARDGRRGQSLRRSRGPRAARWLRPRRAAGLRVRPVGDVLLGHPLSQTATP